MADCGLGCSGGCKTTCTGTCDGECTNTCIGGCSTTCTGGCDTTCRGSCEGTCRTTCKGTCKGECKGTCKDGCTNNCVAACLNTCNDTCEGNCHTECDSSCYDGCKSVCKGYCASICQTYCETEQVFYKNTSALYSNPPSGGGEFNWTNPIKKGEIIEITASDWNQLKVHITWANTYCSGGTKPKLPIVSKGDFITAAQYNDLAAGLGFDESDMVEANKTIISADLIDQLRIAYHTRMIKNTLPSGKNPVEGGQNSCCQKKQTCMSSGELLSHQSKTEKCGDQSTSSCGNQTAGS